MPRDLARALAERFVELKTREEVIATELLAYKELLDLCPCPMLLTTRDGVVVYVNRSYCDMLGVTLEEVAVNGWRNLVAERDRDRVVNAWETGVKAQADEIKGTVTFAVKGTEIEAYWHAKLMVNNGYAVIIHHPSCAFLPISGCSAGK